MRAAIVAVLLALLIVFAGCASPQSGQEEGGDPGQAESPTTADNDAGAEPVAPPNETNNESGGTVQPDDSAAANESDGNETTGADGANESGDVGAESYQVAATALPFTAVGHGALFG